MTPELKITYFDFPGRAEASRLALVIGDIPFEDERLVLEEFPSRRHALPYGSLPVLTVDGMLHAQSAAILRYCGRIAGLYPQDALEAVMVDEVVETVIDFVSGLERVLEEAQKEDDEREGDEDDDFDHNESDEAEGLNLEAGNEDDEDDDDEGDGVDSMAHVRLLKYVNEGVPKFLGGLEKRLKSFGTGPWAVGNDITIADLAIYVCLLNIAAGAFDYMTMRPIKAYMRIMSSFKAVRSHPKVAAWNDEIARKAQ